MRAERRRGSARVGVPEGRPPGARPGAEGPGEGAREGAGGDSLGRPSWHRGPAAPGRRQHPAPLLTVRARSEPAAGRPRGAGLRRARAPAGVSCQPLQAAASGIGGIRVSWLPAPARVCGPSPGPRPRCCLLIPSRRPSRAPLLPLLFIPESGGPSPAPSLPQRAHARAPRNALSLGSWQRTGSWKLWGWAISEKPF